MCATFIAINKKFVCSVSVFLVLTTPWDCLDNCFDTLIKNNIIIVSRLDDNWRRSLSLLMTLIN